ncbi:alkyl sulfatase C-terminal domain-containing protein [Kitasatospora sp. NPDC098663]|uniref:alkyl sulfatase C-terminal domain-containing protein n=1 Tax=Kitasatospora sp. NPDC098663 TaxID=3364096 RepID=UPI00382F54E6
MVFAQPDHEAARELLADTYEQLGYGAENGTWRCAYLSGAYELRHGGFGTPVSPVTPDVLAQLTPEQVLDALAVRVNSRHCWREHLALDLDLTDTGTRYRLVLHNGVLTCTAAAQTAPADAVLHLPATAPPAIATGGADPTALGETTPTPVRLHAPGADPDAEGGAVVRADAQVLPRWVHEHAGSRRVDGAHGGSPRAHQAAGGGRAPAPGVPGSPTWGVRHDHRSDRRPLPRSCPASAGRTRSRRTAGTAAARVP